jgi:hypothetical protein
MRSSAPDIASLSMWASALARVPWLRPLEPSRVPQLQTSPPCRGGLRCYHVAPASPPQEEISGAAMYHTTPSGLWTTGIKKCLAAPGTQLSSYVSKARSCITEAPARRADRPLQFSSTVQRIPVDHFWMSTVVARPDSTAQQR